MIFLKNLLLIGVSLVLVLSGCSGSSEKKLPLIGVSVRVADQGKDYCKLEWKVTNKSNINATFRNGNIEQYEIMNMSTNKKYISEKNKLDVVLKNGDEYSNIILLTKLRKGTYNATFWAESGEGTKGTMKLSFEIK